MQSLGKNWKLEGLLRSFVSESSDLEENWWTGKDFHDHGHRWGACTKAGGGFNAKYVYGVRNEGKSACGFSCKLASS